MENLLAARLQMAISLGFHIVFAALGIGMPLLMLISEGLWLRTKQRVYLDLAKKWARATGILFAIGAVSGTALSFELGLLWPPFMKFAGPLIGPAFALEGYAFFIEAIFLGLYLYGWKRLKPRVHWLCGIPVAFSGMASGALVMSANSWMQTPAGFDIQNGQAINIDPIAALLNTSWGIMAAHMILASYMSTAFLVASVYAWGLLKGRKDDYHKTGLTLAMVIGVITAIAQPISGDFSARLIATTQPIKLASMESQFQTEKGAPLRIGGIPNEDKGTIDFAIEIPYGLSLLAFHDPNAEIVGLNSVSRDLWPNVPLVHYSFQVMVGSGGALLLFALWYWFVRWRKREQGKWLLRALLISGALSVFAMEGGWIVTEVGRQPWIIYQVMRTMDAVTPAPGVWWTFTGFVVIYALLAITMVWLLLRLATGVPVEDADEPHGRKRVAVA
ncbi:MAG: cytochrome ubiquinol oxidase subunit I [Chloroflexia bacterium]